MQPTQYTPQLVGSWGHVIEARQLEREIKAIQPSSGPIANGAIASAGLIVTCAEGAYWRSPSGKAYRWTASALLVSSCFLVPFMTIFAIDYVRRFTGNGLFDRFVDTFTISLPFSWAIGAVSYMLLLDVRSKQRTWNEIPSKAKQGVHLFIPPYIPFGLDADRVQQIGTFLQAYPQPKPEDAVA